MSHGLIAAPEHLVQIAQQTFRAALTALSEPVRSVLVPSVTAPDGVMPAVWALVLSLFDDDIRVYWPDCPTHVRANVAFHTRAHMVDAPSDADWLVVSAESPEALSLLDAVSVGTHERPDLAASILFITGEEATDVVAEGPGILGTVEQRLPISHALASRLAQQSAIYPLGFDSYLVLEHAVIGLPRSTRFQVRVD